MSWILLPMYGHEIGECEACLRSNASYGDNSVGFCAIYFVLVSSKTQPGVNYLSSSDHEQLTVASTTPIKQWKMDDCNRGYSTLYLVLLRGASADNGRFYTR